jgi:voltage-gated potassium channel Kch
MEAKVPLLDVTINGKAAATPPPTGRSRARSDEAPSARARLDSLTQGSALAGAQQNVDNLTSFDKSQKFRWLLAFGVVWLVCGVAFFMSWGLTLVDALYLMVQILTTVGFGDMVPETDAEKIITAFFVLSSTLLMAGLISHAIDMLLDSQAAMLEASLQQKEEQIKKGRSKDPKEDEDRFNKLKKALCVQIGVFCCFVIAGTLFFHFVEGCSCSYGKTRIEGCDDMDCYETGGNTKSLVDCFYMSVITLSTVGFGDEVAESVWGRLFSIFWMLFGVGSIINLVGSVTDFLNEILNGSEKKKVAQDLFDKMDQDGDGNLDRLEFLRMQLVMLGLASEDDLDSIMHQFDLIDESGDGNISLDEFKQFYM